MNMTYARRVLGQTKQEERLQTDIDKIEIDFSETNEDELKELRNELSNLLWGKMEGTTVRSRTRWTEEGEKPGVYFSH